MADKRIPAATIRAAWADLSVSATVAAERIGLSRNALHKRAKRMGLPPRPDGRRPKANERLLRRLWLAGVPAKEIARLFGCHTLTISQTVRRIPDLPMRAPGGYRRGPTLEQVLEDLKMQRIARTAQSFAQTAAMEQAQMINAEMADRIGSTGAVVGSAIARQIGRAA